MGKTTGIVNGVLQKRVEASCRDCGCKTGFLGGVWKERRRHFPGIWYVQGYSPAFNTTRPVLYACGLLSWLFY